MRLAVFLAVAVWAQGAAAAPLEDGMARLAETVAPQLLDERLRPGVEGPVDLHLLEPADATTGEACAALSDTLLFRMAAAMQAALRDYRRDVASVILHQRAAEGELAMRLDWVARKPGLLELRPSYGRMRGDNIVGTFILPVEIATSDLSPTERACFVDASAEDGEGRGAEPPQPGQRLSGGAEPAPAPERVEVPRLASVPWTAMDVALENRLNLSPSEKAAIREALADQGFLPDAIARSPTGMERDAIRAWQESRGLRPTGYLGEDAVAALLKPAPAPAPARRLKDFTTFRECPECPEMVVLPTGTFMMGSPASERGRREREGPQHRRRVMEFAISTTEVTFDMWQACVDGGGCRSNPRPDDNGWGRDKRPVMNVSWEDAQGYLDWLNGRAPTNARYRLPTEAEWEYAARAGSTTPYAFGETLETRRAAAFGGRTVEVDRMDAQNIWGVRHMHGNVYEFVEDCWHSSYAGAPDDRGPWLDEDGGDCTRRVIRGGSWSDGPSGTRSAARSAVAPDLRALNIGFRVARSFLINER